jgi:hypothetical protein
MFLVLAVSREEFPLGRQKDSLVDFGQFSTHLFPRILFKS